MADTKSQSLSIAYLSALPEFKTTPTKLLALDELPIEKRRLLHEWLKLCGAERAVLTGALSTNTLSEVRPLVLEGGEIILYRFLSLKSDAKKYGLIAHYLERAFNGKGLTGGEITHPALNGGSKTLWYRRQYAPRTLKSAVVEEDLDLPTILQILKRVLVLLKESHAANIFHGHLTLENIALDSNNKVSLLDYAASFYEVSQFKESSKRRSTISPDQELSSSTDIYGFGVILTQLARARKDFGEYLGRNHLSLVLETLKSDASLRPKLGVLKEVVKLPSKKVNYNVIYTISAIFVTVLLFGVWGVLINSEKKESGINETILTTMPLPAGAVFRGYFQLSKEGGGVGGELRCLMELVKKPESVESFRCYFAGDSNKPERALAKLDILKPLVNDKSFRQGLWQFLQGSEGILSAPIKWFRENGTFTSWSGQDELILSKLVLGEFPKEENFKFDQLADLLTFPRVAIREAAIDSVAVTLPRQKRLLSGLSFKEGLSDLSRKEIVGLLLALASNEKTKLSLITKWFEESPSPKAVIELLKAYVPEKLSAKDKKIADPLTIAAARYLNAKMRSTNLQLKFEDLKVFAFHPESLVRALAYANLNPQLAKEREVIREALSKESEKRLRDELIAKLE